MAEPELGPLFRRADADLPKVDIDVVVERSRRRRERRLVVARSAVALLIVGALGSGAYGLAHLGGGVGNSASSGVSGRTVPAAEEACVGPSPSTVHSAGGLVARVEFGSMRASQASARGTVTLVNSGSKTISGTAGEPTVALSSNGTVIWRTSTTDSKGILVHLKPGASMTVDAYIQSGACAPAGTYLVTASMNVEIDSGTTLSVTSAPSTLVVRP